MNAGKQFEADFKASVPKEVWYYRFKDGTANFNGQKNENVRFQAKNIADCEIFQCPSLFVFELKSTISKMLPFSMVRDNQVKELTLASKHHGLHAGFIVNFRAVAETYFITIDMYNHLAETSERKSIPLLEFQANCIQVESQIKKVHYKYNVSKLLVDINERTSL